MGWAMALGQGLRFQDHARNRREMASSLKDVPELAAHTGDLPQQIGALLVQHILVEDLSGTTATGLCLKILVLCEDDLDWEPSLVAGHANHPNADGETASAQTSRRALKVVSA